MNNIYFKKYIKYKRKYLKNNNTYTFEINKDYEKLYKKYKIKYLNKQKDGNIQDLLSTDHFKRALIKLIADQSDDTKIDKMIKKLIEINKKSNIDTLIGAAYQDHDFETKLFDDFEIKNPLLKKFINFDLLKKTSEKKFNNKLAIEIVCSRITENFCKDSGLHFLLTNNIIPLLESKPINDYLKLLKIDDIILKILKKLIEEEYSLFCIDRDIRNLDLKLSFKQAKNIIFSKSGYDYEKLTEIFEQQQKKQEQKSDKINVNVEFINKLLKKLKLTKDNINNEFLTNLPKDNVDLDEFIYIFSILLPKLQLEDSEEKIKKKSSKNFGLNFFKDKKEKFLNNHINFYLNKFIFEKQSIKNLKKNEDRKDFHTNILHLLSFYIINPLFKFGIVNDNLSNNLACDRLKIINESILTEANKLIKVLKLHCGEFNIVNKIVPEDKIGKFKEKDEIDEIISLLEQFYFLKNKKYPHLVDNIQLKKIYENYYNIESEEILKQNTSELEEKAKVSLQKVLEEKAKVSLQKVLEGEEGKVNEALKDLEAVETAKAAEAAAEAAEAAEAAKAEEAAEAAEAAKIKEKVAKAKADAKSEAEAEEEAEAEAESGCKLSDDVSSTKISEGSIIYEWIKNDNKIAEYILFSKFEYNTEKCDDTGLKKILEPIIINMIEKFNYLLSGKVGFVADKITNIKDLINDIKKNIPKIMNYILSKNINEIYFLIICFLQFFSNDGYVGWVFNDIIYSPNLLLFELINVIFKKLKNFGLEAPCIKNKFTFDKNKIELDLAEKFFEIKFDDDNIYKKFFLLNFIGIDKNIIFNEKKIKFDVINLAFDKDSMIFYPNKIDEFNEIYIKVKKNITISLIESCPGHDDIAYNYSLKFINIIEENINYFESYEDLQYQFFEDAYKKLLDNKDSDLLILKNTDADADADADKEAEAKAETKTEINIYDNKKIIFEDEKIIIYGDRFNIEYKGYITTAGWDKFPFYFKDCQDFELAGNNVILIKMEGGSEYRSVENFNNNITTINKIISLLYYLKYKNLQI